MRADGSFSIKKIGDVIHTYPEGGFNEFGIMKYKEAIIATVVEGRS